MEKTKEGEFSVKLEINEVEESDKGSYKLVASNEKGEAVSQVVNLVDIPEEERKSTAPKISKKLIDQTVTESSTFELLISLQQSDKKCKIEWYKNASLIKETKDITKTFDGTTARLTFSSAKLEHTSKYKVIVSNEAGKDESSCSITVEKEDKMKKKKEKEKKEEQKETEKKQQVISSRINQIEQEETNIAMTATTLQTAEQQIVQVNQNTNVLQVEVQSKKQQISILNQQSKVQVSTEETSLEQQSVVVAKTSKQVQFSSVSNEILVCFGE